MPLDLNLPPARAYGEHGQVADYNLLLTALQAAETYINSLELTITNGLSARPIIDTTAAGPASPVEGQGWLDW